VHLRLRYDIMIMKASGKECGSMEAGGAVSWLRRLVAGLSSRSPGFAPGSIHVGFAVDKVALRQVFPFQYYSTVVLHAHPGDEQYVR
jgi:hypothetical protein